MPARQPVDFRERVVDPLRVERASAGEEGVLVAEVAVLWTPAGDDDRVGDEVVTASNQVAADGGNPLEGAAAGRLIDRQGAARAEVREERRERLLPGTEENDVRVGGGFLRQRRHVEAAECDEAPLGPIGVRQRVRAPG